MRIEIDVDEDQNYLNTPLYTPALYPIPQSPFNYEFNDFEISNFKILSIKIIILRIARFFWRKKKKKKKWSRGMKCGQKINYILR